MSATKKYIILLALVIATAVAFFAYEAIRSARLNSPEHALEQVKTAILEHNTKTFQRYVNTEKTALSILSNMLAEAKADEPKAAAPSNPLEQVGQALGARLGKKVASFIQPELSKNLQEQMLQFVEQGSFESGLNLSHLYDGKPMLQSIWEDFAGADIVFEGAEVLQQSNNQAMAGLYFKRPTLEFNGTLNLLMEKTEDQWQIIGFSNLNSVLEDIAQKRLILITTRNAEIRQQLDESISVLHATKSAGVSKWGVGKGLLLNIAFENTTEKNIDAFHATVHFIGPEGTLLREVTISETDLFPSKMQVEKSWPMGINPLSEDDNYIFQAADTSLTIDVQITSLVFEDGEKIELIDTEEE